MTESSFTGTKQTFETITGPFHIGSFTLHLISDGLMRLSGQSMFRTTEQVDDVPIPKASERPEGEHRRTGRTLVGLNALLIQDGKHNVLVDTGIGNKQEVAEGKSYEFERPRKLLSGLAELSLQASDITHVINTHLHFDHCGGNTIADADGNLSPAFPNATYFMARGEVEYAQNPPPRERRDFPLVNILPILESGQMELWDHDGELLPGIEVQTTGGHTRDHAIVIIRSRRRGNPAAQEFESACFLADLIPTASHLHPSLVMKYDLFPDDVKKYKRSLLERAVRENWLLLFDHAPRVKAGRVELVEKRFVFREK